MKYLRIVMGAVTLVGLALLLTNCEQKSSTGSGDTLGPGTIGGIDITASDLSLYTLPGDPISTNVTATVTDKQGAAVAGILVSFTTTLGSIATTQTTTDSSGQITVTFSSQNQFGLATVVASVASGNETVTNSIGIGVWALTGLAYDISLSLDPTILYLAPGIDDSVQATVRVYDSLHVGIPGLHVTLTSNLGVVSLPDTTNLSGTVVTYLYTNQQYGVYYVTASVNTSLPDTGTGQGPDNLVVTWPGLKTGNSQTSGLEPSAGNSPPNHQLDEIFTISAMDTLWVYPIDMQLSNLTISASPSQIYVAPDTSGSSIITATVVDENNNGVPGVPVEFATNMGVIIASDSTTNAGGQKSVIYSSLANHYGDAKIWAVVGGLETDTCDVFITGAVADSGSLQVYTSAKVIYADYGITNAVITALLKDADNQVITSAPIIFTSTFGTINSPVNTNSIGQATGTFQALGTYSQPDSATVTAKYLPLNLEASVNIMILPARQIDHIVLDAAQSYLTANYTDSTRVDATVYLEGNELAPAGTEVSFYVSGDNIGTFMTVDTVVTSAGTATVFYKAGSVVGIDSLYAVVEDTFSNFVSIELLPGPPQQIFIASDTTVLAVNSIETATITATVQDTLNNLVGNNIGVLFTTTLGSIFPTQALTMNGVATTHLSPTTTAGPAWIKASVGAYACSLLVTFTSLNPASISLSADSPTITVLGGGTGNATGIDAEVRDASNNLITETVWVQFLIVNGSPGGGVNLNNEGLQDSAQTFGGIASVVLNAGTSPGPVQLRAYTFTDTSRLDTIATQQSLVSIVAGPPATINVNINSNEPENGGGDQWVVEVSAHVVDAIGNQVPNNTAVSFYLNPITGIAQIQGSGYTGNPNSNGDTYPGTAFTSLTYHSYETFDSVTVYAWCGVGADSIIGLIGYLLPLAGGELELLCIPINWNYTNPPEPYNPNDPCRIECRAYLYDGHDLPINNGSIVFYASPCGYYYTSPNWNPGNPPTPDHTQLTGPPGSPAGYALLWYMASYVQAFPDPTIMSRTATLHAQVERFPAVTSENQTITFEQTP